MKYPPATVTKELLAVIKAETQIKVRGFSSAKRLILLDQNISQTPISRKNDLATVHEIDDIMLVPLSCISWGEETLSDAPDHIIGLTALALETPILTQDKGFGGQCRSHLSGKHPKIILLRDANSLPINAILQFIERKKQEVLDLLDYPHIIGPNKKLDLPSYPIELVAEDKDQPPLGESLGALLAQSLGQKTRPQNQEYHLTW